MDKLLDLMLFSEQFQIQNKYFYLFFQLSFKIERNKFCKILILSSDKTNSVDNNTEFFVCGFNDKKKEIIPISCAIFEKLCVELKELNKTNHFGKLLNNTNPLNADEIGDFTLFKPNNNIQFLLSKNLQFTTNALIELKFLDNKKIKPKELSFYSSNSLDSNIKVLFIKEEAKKIKEWHTLSGFEMKINNIYTEKYYPETVKTDGNDIIMNCSPSFAPIMKSVVLDSFHAENLDVYEITDFILSVSGMDLSMEFPPDYQPIKTNWYTVILAIEGLVIKNDFGIGNVEFVSKENEEAQRVINYDNNLDIFNAFAIVHINDNKLYNAYIKGKKQIERSIDFLSSVYRDDSILSAFSTGKRINCVDFYLIEKKFQPFHRVYIESPLTHARISYNLSNTKSNVPATISSSFIEKLDEFNKIELLLIQNNKDENKKTSPLFNAFKWIKKAWESTSNDDRIIDAIIALEFVVSTEKLPNSISKKTRRECRNRISEVLMDSSEYCEEQNPEAFLNKMLDKVDRAFTEPSFMNKLLYLIKRLDIPVIDLEIDLIKKARKLRNNIIHGNDEKYLSNLEIYSLCETISRITYYKLKSLEA